MTTTLRSLRNDIRSQLKAKFGDRESAALTDEIFFRLMGWDNVKIALNLDKEVSDFIIGKTGAVIARLLNDEPLQYIFGRAHFYGLDLKVTPDTLIPRPETAALVDMIVDENNKPDLKVLDLGTGSGCIAIALARHLRFPSVTAVDISPGALSVAQENASELNVRITFILSDMLSEHFPSQYDIIVSNPPYISDCERPSIAPNVLEHEPHSALFVPDSDPLRFYKAIARIATESLSEHGKIYTEVNPNFAPDVKTLFVDEGFSDAAIIKDLNGLDRFVTAKR